MNEHAEMPVIEAVDLKKFFKVKAGMLHAVDGISFKIMNGETLGVVGESGCGKSTLGRTIVGLHKPTDGTVLFRGTDMKKMSRSQRRSMNTKMSMIFQDPYSSLNPRMCVADLILDPMRINKLNGTRRDQYKKVKELMDTVGLSKRVASSYPHELDGGRRQRVGVARALAVNPEFIVCDEPVSALDVSIQAQILNLLMNLQDDLGLTYMFVTHDLSVVHHISKKVMVVYLGKCVEFGNRDQIFENPKHPYTKALLSALPEPTLEARYKKSEIIKGEISNPINPKPGCGFAPRCVHRMPVCTEGDIPFTEVESDHLVACKLFREGKSG